MIGVDRSYDSRQRAIAPRPAASARFAHRRTRRRFALLLGAAALIASCASYPASSNPQAPAGVRVDREGDLIWLTQSTEPRTATAEMGVIFYPGGLVDPEAYVSMLAPIAAEGFPVVIIRMPQDLAVFGWQRAGQVLDAPAIADRWIMGGHSLGGAMAARFAAERASEFPSVQGLYFLGSYPADDLSAADFEVVSVWASEDGLATREDRDATREWLPRDTRYVKIQGGNHAGFGEYGPQRDDGELLIPLEEQHRKTRNALFSLIESAQEK